MKHLIAVYEKYSGLLLALLKPLGFWGIGLLAVLDSSSIPVPMDAFIAFYAWHDSRRFYLYVIMAAIGSAIGGLLPYFVGRAGGEIFLLKRVNRARFEAMRNRFERQEFMAILIPSMMPPPTPWKLFVFGAGVFEMRVVNFMLAVFVGRLIRFGVESLLVIRYGPEIIHEFVAITNRHMVAVITLLAIMVALLAFYGIRKVKRTI
ncbi:MAG TPA: VTT domain-containing protein [Terracidiphilus sp.]|nr:VTT domain-containing protein [Terracidiphilus sp.]